jgi:LPS-assembly lipoprotein
MSLQLTARRQILRYISLGLSAALGLAGCGFKLREQVALRFESIWINLPKQSEFGGELRRAIVSLGGTRIESDPEKAQRRLYVDEELRTREIIGFTVTGRPRDVRLQFKVVFRVIDQSGLETVSRSEILLHRDISTSDVLQGAKQQEERFLQRDMQAEVIERILRQLRSA